MASLPGTSHPECPPDVLEEADFVGAPAGMSRYVFSLRPVRVTTIGECSLSGNLAVELVGSHSLFTFRPGCGEEARGRPAMRAVLPNWIPVSD